MLPDGDGDVFDGVGGAVGVGHRDVDGFRTWLCGVDFGVECCLGVFGQFVEVDDAFFRLGGLAVVDVLVFALWVVLLGAGVDLDGDVFDGVGAAVGVGHLDVGGFVP